ncbi:ThuA domain-containing protein [Azospirillum thermophilum]|uniref:Trehalose utilization protein ThuA n=1 Tax=Azospirillum thermophilum TaxID=2202148 RepID=A0A2S2CQJ7_9PROT|nr:ThuA domain-containing protein [Azospirillum thermophilum]AWK86705.1 trehalose utilization protein ThuA [Azospirillum thermophilum]
MTRVLVWSEHRQDRTEEAVKAVYPQGIHEALAAPLRAAGLEVTTATLDEPEHGLAEERLAAADTLVWWGHRAHAELPDALAGRVRHHVTERGMGFVPLHSSHFSKPFLALMGTGCYLKHRVAGEAERLWVVDPGHPVAAGIEDHILLPQEEMYGEPFDIPPPEDLVFISWFKGGEVFRSGCGWRRGLGRVFYFRPGHETYPTFHHPQIRRVILNAVRWTARPPDLGTPVRGRRSTPPEPL